MSSKRTFAIVSAITFIVCSYSLVGATGLKGGENKIILEYDFNKPIVTKWQGYDLVKMEDLESYERTGAPIVPVRPVTILIPYGKKVVDIQSTVLSKSQLPGTYLLKPAQKEYPMSYIGRKEPTEPDVMIYKLDVSWPGNKHKQIGTGSKRGYQLLTLVLFPLQYVPATGNVTYATKMRLEVELVDSADKSVFKPSEDMKKTLKNKVDNPNALSSYEPAEIPIKMQALIEGSSALSGETYKYVIITSQELADYNSSPWTFQALRDHRIMHGLPSTIVSTEWIYTNYDANEFDPNNYDPNDPNADTNRATEIRMFLRDAYLNWETEYVLLGGDSSIIPIRYLSFPYEDKYEYIPADIYYGCVDPEESFNGDEDEYYGEIDDGIDGNDVDLLAEINVGRAAVENVTEMINFVRKTLTYDATYDVPYHSRITMLGGHLDLTGAEYAKPLLEQIRLGGEYDEFFAYGFENQPLPYFYDFDTSVNLYDADEGWSCFDVFPLMNGGTHVFNSLCHGSHTLCMKMGTRYDLPFEVNNEDYFFVYAQDCLSGGFDANDCFAEVITTMEHGAFAVIMNSEVGHLTSGHHFNRCFWDAVFGEQRVLEVGGALHVAKETNLWDVKNVCTSYARPTYFVLNLFGDPAQQLKFAYTPSAGYVLLDDEYYACDSNVAVVLLDHDLQCSGTQEVNLVTSGGDIETLVLNEEVPTYGIFRGIITAEAAEPNQQDGYLQVFDGHTVTVIYNDTNDGTGSPAAANDTAVLDCNGPDIFNVDFEAEFTASMLTINFETSEPAAVRVECGTTCGSEDIVVEDNQLLLIHSLNITVPEAGEYYFTIEATDYVGNSTVDSNGGSCYSFTSLPGPITVPDDYPTIEDAIASIPESGTREIIIKPGTYYETLEVRNKVITFRGTDPNNWDVVESTVIVGDGIEETFYFSYSSGSQLKGLTISGGGKGVQCYVSGSMNFKNCVIQDNDYGVQLQAECGGTTMENCVIRNNSERGVSAGFSSLTIRNSLIYGNDIGVYNSYGNISIRNCTIIDNNSFGVRKGSSGSASISNCILWNNNDDLSGYSASYSCISDGDSGTGNIAVDPCFIPDDEFYHLLPNSPCVNSGNPGGSYEGQVDIDGNTRVIAGCVDMGSDEALRVYNETKSLWYTTINEAFDDSNDYDVINVYPGTYYESLYMNSLPPDYSSTHVTIQSIDPNDWDVVSATVIDGNGVTNTIYAGYETHPTLSGLTITGGSRGIYAGYPGSTKVTNSIINNNSIGAYFYCCSDADVNNCIIKNNTIEGIYLEAVGDCDLKNTLIHNNDQGIRSYGPVSADIHNCTIVDNSNYGIKGAEYTEFNIKNCIIWDNNDDLYDCNAIYSCISDGDAGSNNISSDPCFVDADSNDFHLLPDSPCINTGDPNDSYNGQTDIDGEIRVFGNRVDMGADEAHVVPDGHWWKLDEGSGTIAYDFIDDDDGTFNGNDPCWVEGIFGSAVDFNGISDYFSIPSLNNAYHPYYTTTFSVAGWFKTEQSTGTQTIVGNWNNYEVAPGYTYWFGWQILIENGVVTGRFGPASSYTKDITGDTEVVGNGWHHFVLVFSSQFSDSYLYVDGELDAEPDTVFGTLYNTQFRIGDASYVSGGDPVIKGGPFSGTIDDIMIFDRVLTADEIEQLYGEGL